MRIKPQDQASGVKFYADGQKLFHQVRSDVDFISQKRRLVGREGNALVAKFCGVACQVE